MTTTPTQPPSPITLMAAGELRDALTALQRGDKPAALYALASIDPTSWTAIEHRLHTLTSHHPQETPWAPTTPQARSVATAST